MPFLLTGPQRVQCISAACTQIVYHPGIRIITLLYKAIDLLFFGLILVKLG